jgi:hypothetical protein
VDLPTEAWFRLALAIAECIVSEPQKGFVRCYPACCLAKSCTLTLAYLYHRMLASLAWTARCTWRSCWNEWLGEMSWSWLACTWATREQVPLLPRQLKAAAPAHHRHPVAVKPWRGGSCGDLNVALWIDGTRRKGEVIALVMVIPSRTVTNLGKNIFFMDWNNLKASR